MVNIDWAKYVVFDSALIFHIWSEKSWSVHHSLIVISYSGKVFNFKVISHLFLVLVSLFLMFLSIKEAQVQTRLYSVSFAFYIFTSHSIPVLLIENFDWIVLMRPISK